MILILCTRLLEVVTLITLIASFLPWHASLILNRIFYVTGNFVLWPWAIGMVKIEAFDDSHFMHQTVRGRHTDHTDSIVSSMACIFDFKKNFLCNRKLRTLALGYSLGMVKIEAFDNSHFMHQTVRCGHTDHTDTCSIIPSLPPSLVFSPHSS